jgi:hypothetical protein
MSEKYKFQAKSRPCAAQLSPGQVSGRKAQGKGKVPIQEDSEQN